jgi:hypothetical protein
MPLRPFNTAELVLTQRTYLERPLLLMVLLGVGAFALAEGDAFYLALMALGVGANVLAVTYKREVYVPRLVVNIAVLGATAVFAMDFFGKPELIIALGHYLILIQFCKLFEQKRNRDYAQMIVLSVMLMLSGSMLTSGLWFGLLLLLYVPVLAYTAMVLTLKTSLDRQALAVLGVENRPIDPHRVAWHTFTNFPRRTLWRRTFQAFAACAVAAVMVFLLIPRGQPGMFLPLPNSLRESAMGFSGAINLRELGRITPSREVVMWAKFTADGRNLGPEGFRGYLRGRVYSAYRGGQWTAGREDWKNVQLEGQELITQQITMRPSLGQTLFALAPVVRMEVPREPAANDFYPGLEGANPDAPVRYVAYSWALPLSERQRADLARARPATPLTPDQIGEVSPRVAELARAWCQDLLPGADAQPVQEQVPDQFDPRERARAPLPRVQDSQRALAIANRIASKLRTEYRYTLDLSGMDPDADPVEDFLFRTRAGHCEFFASAMALMCRSLGVNARVAGGFVADNYSPSAGAYLIRECDAHAWCEVYTPATDWALFDPTAGSVDSPHDSVGDVWDAIKFFWSTRVIGYGEADRRKLVAGVPGDAGQFARWVERQVMEMRQGVLTFLTTGRIDGGFLKALALLAGLVMLVPAGRAVARAWRARVPGAHVAPQGPAFYRRLVGVLARHGCRPTNDQTPCEFLRHAGDQLKLDEPGRAALDNLGQLFYRIRWGRQRPGPKTIRAADASIDELARQLAKPRSRAGEPGPTPTPR